ncbi:AP-3 complex subunit sigma-1-like [Halichondria panicea]|uniref:AP-3 complex subunit sigma-1-like n=1 Tax=Halichondria panicea TaxID=6063 RepID=UPI00312B367D
MIKAILVFNNQGKPRISKFYTYYNEDEQQAIIKEVYHLVSRRDDNICNFLEGSSKLGGGDFRLIYRHYATLYFVFCVDSCESELGVLDLIQVFVETLDRCFENVCELDLIFHMDKVHNIMSEICIGGMVLETNMSEILVHVDAQTKLEKSETSPTSAIKSTMSSAPNKALSAVKNIQNSGLKLPSASSLKLPSFKLH